jgi:hypothetical protein
MINDEVERIWKDTVVTLLEAVFRLLSGGTEEGHGNISGLRCGPGTSRIRRRPAKLSAAMVRSLDISVVKDSVCPIERYCDVQCVSCPDVQLAASFVAEPFLASSFDIPLFEHSASHLTKTAEFFVLIVS